MNNTQHGVRLVTIELKSKAIVLFLSIVGLTGTAISNRIAGMINESPEFYVIYKMNSVVILAFLITICLAVPLLVGALGWLFARNHHTRILTWLLFVVLIALTLSGMMREIQDPTGGWMILVLSIALAAASSYAFLRWDIVRIFLAATALSLPVTLYNSVLSADISFSSFFGVEDVQGLVTEHTLLPNVVFIVLDELPLTTLLDRMGAIDPRRYPNLHSLANQSYWFRQATSVSCDTPTAVPAILSGKLFGKPTPKSLPPLFQNYRQNLFTLLRETHQVKAWETLTQLCPPGICAPGAASPFSLGPFAEHLVVAWSHATLPSAFEPSLPNLDGYWMEAAAIQNVLPKNAHRKMYSVRAQQFNHFVSSIVEAEMPWVRFGHFLMPHAPFQDLPDGSSYFKGMTTYAIKANSWDDQSAHIAQNYFRHLLQAMNTDRLIGLLVDRLRKVGEYDSTTIVIVADHGVSFVPGDTRRITNNLNYPNLMGVPLIIKVANQASGILVDSPVQTIDVLPTLLGTMNRDFGQIRFDGQNVLASNVNSITERLHFCSRRDYASFNPEILSALIEQVYIRDRLFGDREDGTLEMNFSTKPDWIGQPIEKIGIIKPSGRVARLAGLTANTEGIGSRSYVPVYLNGIIIGGKPIGSDDLLFVATLNEQIASVMPAVRHKNNHRIISSMLQPRFLREGRNTIKLYAIDRKADGPVVLLNLQIRDKETGQVTNDIIFQRYPNSVPVTFPP